MRHKLCRSFHPWCPGVKTRCLYIYICKCIFNCMPTLKWTHRLLLPSRVTLRNVSMMDCHIMKTYFSPFSFFFLFIFLSHLRKCERHGSYCNAFFFISFRGTLKCWNLPIHKTIDTYKHIFLVKCTDINVSWSSQECWKVKFCIWFIFIEIIEKGQKYLEIVEWLFYNVSQELSHWGWEQDDVIKRKTFSSLPALFAGNSPVTGEFPAQRPVMRSFDVFFDLWLNKRLSKQKTPSFSLWRHCNGQNGHHFADDIYLKKKEFSDMKIVCIWNHTLLRVNSHGSNLQHASIWHS